MWVDKLYCMMFLFCFLSMYGMNSAWHHHYKLGLLSNKEITEAYQTEQQALRDRLMPTIKERPDLEKSMTELSSSQSELELVDNSIAKLEKETPCPFADLTNLYNRRQQVTSRIAALNKEIVDINRGQFDKKFPLSILNRRKDDGYVLVSVQNPAQVDKAGEDDGRDWLDCLLDDD